MNRELNNTSTNCEHVGSHRDSNMCRLKTDRTSRDGRIG